MRRTARFFHRGDFIEDILIIASQEMPAADDHVDLIRPFASSGEQRVSVLEFDVEWILPGWKTRCHRSHIDPAPLEVVFGDLH